MQPTNTTEQPVSQEEQLPQQDLFADVVDTEPYEKTMKNARVWLYVIAGFQAAMGIFEYNTAEDATIGMIACIIDVSIAILFTGLALYSKKNPVTAFTTALILYIVLIAGFIALDPSNATKGVVVKVLAIMALVKANNDARKYVALKQSIFE
jgi:hypothetical protein